MNNTEHKRSRGGKRIGAGRPSGSGRYGEPTKAIRIPQSLVSSVQSFLAMKDPLLTASSSLYRLPLFQQKISAGFLTPTADHIESFVDLNEHLIKHPDATFLVQAEGDSMIGAGIYPNDLLVVDRKITPQHGHIVIAAINAELTIKRLAMETPDLIQLVPENKAYPIITIQEEMDFRVCGVVTNVIHTVLL